MTRRAPVVLITAGGAGVAGIAALRRSRSRQAAALSAADRWLTVTVNRQPGELEPGKLPSPLREYGERIETRILPAPGDRGTELAVRLTKPRPRGAFSLHARLRGTDPRQELRQALRETKAILEAGEVLQPDAPPTTHETLGGKLVGLLGRRSGGEGVL
jgi:uncharacterized membrane protein